MDVKQELAKFKKIVDKELEIYLDEVIEETGKIDKFSTLVLQDCKENILAGGKRVRPAMMYYGYLAVGGENHEELIKTSISIELVHSFLLIHDDIIDQDGIRHGKETIHSKYKKYSEQYFISKDDEHFGISTGIVLGDFIYSLGMKALFNSKFEAKNLIRALSKMQSVVGRTCVGQVQDVVMEYRGKAVEEEILSMYENKTARYTFEGPLHLGAILAGADDEFCAKLSEFAIPLGIAFQIQDDIIGVFGDSKKTGKPVGSDVSEGKITILTLKAYEKSDDKQKKVLDNLLGNDDLTESELDDFRKVLLDTGALDYANGMSFDLLQEAKLGIEKVDLPDEPKEFLLGLVDYLDEREV
ncbi:MAG: polyprenyl synthetase family protein [Candidatus Moranbacteria bacterium]|nr:polyprenyl synthetase family protein [Candidatus Moranbacteria bacterium]